MQETPVRLLGREDALEKGTATHSSILAWRIPWTVLVPEVPKSWTWLSDLSFTFTFPRSDSKESACNEGEHGSIPGLGRCPGEGEGYPLQ